MFCSKCGIEIENTATSCPNCGKAVVSVSADGTSAKVSGSAHYGKSAQVSKSFDLKNPKILGAIAGVIAVILLFTMCFGGQSYKKAVNNLIDSVFDGNTKQMLKSFPDKVVDQMCEESDMTKKEMIAYLDEMLETEVLEDMNDYYGDNWSVKHKIIGTEEYDSDDLQWIKEDYAEIGVKVKDAKIVNVEMTLTFSGLSDTTQTTFSVIKVGNSWYVDMQNSDLPF